MNKAIEKFLKSVTNAKFSKKSIEVEFKSGKDTIKSEFKGEGKHLKALKEVVKYL
jgi:hypothetical protein